MKCKLNPDIKRFFSQLFDFFYYATLTVSIVFTVYWVFTSIVACFVFSIIKHFELYDFCAYFMPLNESYNSLNSYVVGSSMHFAHTLNIFLFVSLLASLLIYAMFREATESYRMRSDFVQYRFDGVKQPWYRVLISYVLVCEKLE